MKHFKHPATAIAFLALFVSLTGGAIAAKLITGKDIKNGSVKSKDVKNNSLKARDIKNDSLTGRDIKPRSLTGADLKFGSVSEKRLSAGVQEALRRIGTGGANGQNGSQGPKGDTGARGPAGAAGPAGPAGSNTVAYQNPNWGTVFRNTIGSPDIDLAGGPNASTASGVTKPPFGVGSLTFQVDGVPRTADAGAAEKAAFGNEVDFVGKTFDGLSQLGFHVFTTGENAGKGAPNMPTIQMEIDPNLTGVASNFSTLTFQPQNSTANQWSGYIDATTAPANASGVGFFLSGGAGTATGCTNGSPCTFTQLKTALDDDDDSAATVLSVSVAKGRDFEWQGAIDGLRVAGLGNGDQTFDFEPFGTIVR